MRLPLFMLMLLGILWGALIWGINWGDKSKPLPHPTANATDENGQQLVAMLVGKDVAANDQLELAGPGFLFGASTIILITVVMLLAAEDAHHRKLLQVSIAAVGASFLTGFAYMFWQWWMELKNGPMSLGPFPKSTSLMLIAVAVVPLLFSVIYVLGFRLWFGIGETDSCEASR